MELEPFFLINEFLEEEKKELENLIDVTKGPKIKNQERSVFIKNFTNDMFKAYRNQRARFLRNEKEESNRKQLLELIKRKEMLLDKIKVAEKIENVKKNEEKAKKNIVVSKVTKKPLVTSSFFGNNYKVNEPLLNDIDLKILQSLKESKINDENLTNYIKDMASRLNINCDDEYIDKIRYYFIRDVKKFSLVSPLLEDNNIKEIVCNGENRNVIVTYQDKQEIPTNIIFKTDNEINNMIKLLIAKSGQKINNENPFFNFNIGNEFEVQVTLGNEFLKPKFIIIRK